MTHEVLPQLVGAIGEVRFGPALAMYLHDLCGAQHFAAFRFGSGQLTEVAACCVDPERTARERVESYVQQGWWKRDPAMARARQLLDTEPAAIIKVDWSDSAYQELRPRVYPDVRDRLLLCGRVADGAFGLSILRDDPHAPFATEAIERFRAFSDLLLAILAKHASVCMSRRDASVALAHLGAIEACIHTTNVLPRREAEVCARILFGISSAGIALDLGISEETIKTYRKRAYQRLLIGCERELLQWYLVQWDRCNGASAQPVDVLH